jgi:cytochrome c biogenesis protein
MKIIRSLASLRLTLAGMLLLVTGVLVSYLDASGSPAWLVLPLLLLAFNLLVALLVNPRLSRHPGLLGFHLCLLVIAVLAAASQLTLMEGRVELAEGQAFTADDVAVIRHGPWHSPEQLESLAFVQGPIQIDYAAGLRRGQTRSTIRPMAGQGPGGEQVVGDTRPLKRAGYRLYTTSNKGYAAILNWSGEDGVVHGGALHFPSYPRYDWKQVNRWTTPTREPLALELRLGEPTPVDRSWVLDSRDPQAALLVSGGSDGHVLLPGEAVQLAGGSLRFEGLRLWMGYEIYYNPFLPWLFTAAVIGVLALGWYFSDRFRAGAAAVSPAGSRTEMGDAVPSARH